MAALEFSLMDASTLGQRLRLARENARLTQEQLGDRVGVTHGAVSQWETGAVSRISATNLRRTASVLRVSLDWLLSGEDGPGLPTMPETTSRLRPRTLSCWPFGTSSPPPSATP